MTELESVHRCPFEPAEDGGRSHSGEAGTERKRGVLLVSFGSAGSADDLGEFLRSVCGAPPDDALLRAARERYLGAGGSSPLAGHLEHQRSALAAALGRRGIDASIRAAALHPAAALAASLVPAGADAESIAGLDDLLVVPLAPQFSTLVTGAVCEALERAVPRAGGGPAVEVVHDWHLEPRLVAALASAAYEALDALWAAGSSWRPNVDWALGSKMDSHVVFVAPAVPVVAAGEPYARLVEETAAEVAASLGLRSWSHGFFGWIPALAAGGAGVAGAIPGPTPSLPDRLRDLADRDERDVVVCPVGTVADDVDLVYEVDVAGQALAETLGLRLERARSLNDDPVLVAALADVVQRSFGGATR